MYSFALIDWLINHSLMLNVGHVRENAHPLRERLPVQV